MVLCLLVLYQPTDPPTHHDGVAPAGDVLGRVEVDLGPLQADDAVRSTVRGARFLFGGLLVLVEDHVGPLQHHEGLRPALSAQWTGAAKNSQKHTLRNKINRSFCTVDRGSKKQSETHSSQVKSQIIYFDNTKKNCLPHDFKRQRQQQ